MNEIEFENKLQVISKGLDYPSTPDISADVMKKIRPATSPQRFISRRLTWSLTLILILFISLFAIPPVRAAILEFIQIGIVRIFPQSPEPTVETPITAIPEFIVPKTATSASSDLIPILSQIAGETTLANAQKLVDYEILLPAYPAELGTPDHVFVQDADGQMTILVWIDPQNAEKVIMSLHFIPAGSWAIDKGFPVDIWETQVNGHRAIWGEGPYPLRLYNGDLEFMRLITGHVLIWEEEDITYRLETDLPVEEAVKIAESLEPIP